MIYLDNAATTPLCKAAKQAIVSNLDTFGNPSSIHTTGHLAKTLIEDAREKIASLINADPNEIYFTSGGSEANTWALLGRKTLTSPIEHHSIKSDYTYKMKGNKVDLDEIRRCINRCNPDIVSTMHVNNELGFTLPVKCIAEIAHDHGVLFHTDAVQSVSHFNIDVKDMKCDMLSFSAHKFGGTKGVGCLYIKAGTPVNKLILGGKQERGLRGGTENVLGIVAMAAALEDTVKAMKRINVCTSNIIIKLYNDLLDFTNVGIDLNSFNPFNSQSGIINFSIKGINGQELVQLASLHGFEISSGSACNEGNNTPSSVLKALGYDDDRALSSIRISVGRETTEEEINKFIYILPKLIDILKNK